MFWTHKGGVGKTTLCLHSAITYAELNPKQAVVMLDLDEQANLSSTVCTELEALTVEHLNETLASFSGRGKKAKVVKVLLYLLAPSTVKAERDVGVALSKTFNVASGGGEQLLEALKKAVTKLTNNGLNEDEDEAFACVQCPSSNEKERFSQRDSPARLDCCHC